MKQAFNISIAIIGSIYIVGFVVTGAALAISDRYQCFEKRGVIGIFWCPEEAIKARFGGYFFDSLFWPKYLFPKK